MDNERFVESEGERHLVFNPLMATGKPRGFAYSRNGEDVAITHFGKAATVLRGARAQQFLAAVGCRYGDFRRWPRQVHRIGRDPGEYGKRTQFP